MKKKLDSKFDELGRVQFLFVKVEFRHKILNEFEIELEKLQKHLHYTLLVG